MLNYIRSLLICKKKLWDTPVLVIPLPLLSLSLSFSLSLSLSLSYLCNNDFYPKGNNIKLFSKKLYDDKSYQSLIECLQTKQPSGYDDRQRDSEKDGLATDESDTWSIYYYQSDVIGNSFVFYSFFLLGKGFGIK